MVGGASTMTTPSGPHVTCSLPVGKQQRPDAAWRRWCGAIDPCAAYALVVWAVMSKDR